MLRSLNDSIHLSRLVPSRHISTSELRNKSWIELTFESFRVFSASAICFSTRNFLTSVIAFSMIFAHWLIDEDEGFIACIREYVSNISKMSTSPSEWQCHWLLLWSFEALFFCWRSFLGPRWSSDMLDEVQHDTSLLRLLINELQSILSLWWSSLMWQIDETLCLRNSCPHRLVCDQKNLNKRRFSTNVAFLRYA